MGDSERGDCEPSVVETGNRTQGLMAAESFLQPLKLLVFLLFFFFFSQLNAKLIDKDFLYFLLLSSFFLSLTGWKIKKFLTKTLLS